jgi:hypothetical protein
VLDSTQAALPNADLEIETNQGEIIEAAQAVSAPLRAEHHELRE